MQRFIVLMIITFGLISIFWTCKDEPTKPKNDTSDTTSHSFSFTTKLLGDGTGSSTLYDVAIINDTLAYACGAIYSGGSICDLARWNGQQWDTMRISVTLTYANSQLVTDQDPLKTISAFSENDIWIVSQAGGVSHWNGTQWVMLSIPFNQGPGACNKIWGTSSTDLFFVGNNGRIIHYNGIGWTQIQSGTTLNINDIWGDFNASTGKYEILCVASNLFESPGKEIIKINGTNAQLIDAIGIAGTLSSVWFKAGYRYYVAGGGIYQKNDINQSGWSNGQFDISTYSIAEIRADGVNDIVAAGGVGEVLHYNGSSWRSYFTETKLSDGNYNSVAIKNNLIVAVGEDSPNAAIVIGKR